MKELFEQLQVEMNKFYAKGNKAAGTRARMIAQRLKEELDKVRRDISAKKKEAA